MELRGGVCGEGFGWWVKARVMVDVDVKATSMAMAMAMEGKRLSANHLLHGSPL